MLCKWLQAGIDLEDVRVRQERSAKQGRAEAAQLEAEGRTPISEVRADAAPGWLVAA